MFDIAVTDEPAEKKNRCANREQTRSTEICQPEQLLWEPSSQADSPRIALIQLIAFILYVTIAVIAVASCLAELSQLLDNCVIG